MQALNVFAYQIKTPHSCILKFLRETILSFYQTRTHNNVSSRYQSYQSSSKILGHAKGRVFNFVHVVLCVMKHYSTVKPPVSDHPECEESVVTYGSRTAGGRTAEKPRFACNFKVTIYVYLCCF